MKLEEKDKGTSLVERVKESLIYARKSKSDFINVYQNLIARLDNMRVEVKVKSVSELTDEQVRQAVKQEVKQIGQQIDFARTESEADDLGMEIGLLYEFLPYQETLPEAIKLEVDKIAKSLNLTIPAKGKDIGVLINKVNEELLKEDTELDSKLMTTYIRTGELEPSNLDNISFKDLKC
ncbi:hypothetical protein [Listeria phage LMTA-148]|uniref:Uncharacterized protein n=1 Tax=Listeria phage LMTA-148 TaxID=1486413 RepID=A0A068C7S4_9CAUD|nr:tRNA amidotransferase [Listeria phage LMTA-148]AID17333.1 hypothetical protein [Listeria phage LMTA-148]